MNASLYRSRTNSVLGGVCGGLGQYLKLEPTLVRLVFIILALADGIGILIYLVLWLITPLEGQAETGDLPVTARANADEIVERARSVGEDVRRTVATANPQAGVALGAVLIGLGVIFLLQNLNLAWLWWLKFDVLWPSVLIIVGAVLLLRRAKEG
ncbi:MAG: PspC domain-containing protein [Thermoflexales bacterium]|nr:PspC domain-containing protein [Thermoflexales bacterium]